jgi:hypothetical protein
MSLWLVALPVPRPSHRVERNNLRVLLAFGFQFTRCWTSGGWYVGQSLDQFLVQFNPLCHQDFFIFCERNKFQHTHEIGVPTFFPPIRSNGSKDEAKRSSICDDSHGLRDIIADGAGT